MKIKNFKNLIVVLIMIISYVLSCKNVYAQSNSNYNSTEFVISSSYSMDQKGIVEFQKQKDSIISWFSNRIIENSKYQRKFNRIRNKVLKRLNNTTLVRVPRIKIEGIAEWKNDTIFYADIVLKQKKYVNVFTHELAHDAFPVIRDSSLNIIHNDMKKWMIELIDEAIKKSGGIGFNEIGLFLKYYNRPDEVYSRICAFRVACNLKPNQKCTEDDLLKILRMIHKNDIVDDNSKDLLVLINNEYSLLNLLNNLP